MINHNPLPDVTHEEFVSLLGPLLVPENFEIGHREGSGPNVSGSSGISPFEWMHFEGRSVKTTLSNIIGIDGLAKERKWRSNCVFSLDATKIRQGIEAVCGFPFFESPIPKMSNHNSTKADPTFRCNLFLVR